MIHPDHDRSPFLGLARFASIKRMHVEVSRQQTEDYEKRLQKLKDEEVSDELAVRSR